MIGWLIKKYLKKHLSIRLQHWPMSGVVQIMLLLDDDVISSSSTNKIATNE